MNLAEKAFIIEALADNTNKLFLSFVLPTYNESDNIEEVITGLIEVLNNMCLGE